MKKIANNIENSVSLSIGTNVGDREYYIREMEYALSELLIVPIRQSRLMETEPIGVIGEQKWYLNRIISGKFIGTPRELLECTQSIENRLGRVEKYNRSPRTADIDILLFNSQEIYEEGLVIPHPAITTRRFCIEGLFEISPQQKLAGTNMTIADIFGRMDKLMRNQRVNFL